MKRLFLLAVLAFTLIAATPNLIVNGNFGGTGGWTQQLGQPNAKFRVVLPPLANRTGRAAFLPNNGMIMSNTFNVTVGQTYVISFKFGAVRGARNDFLPAIYFPETYQCQENPHVCWLDGLAPPEYPIDYIGTRLFVRHSYRLIIPGPGFFDGVTVTKAYLAFGNWGNGTYLDDVRVTLVAPAAQTSAVRLLVR